MQRPCLDCGRLTKRTRCLTCTKAYDQTRRPSATERYGPGWAARHRAAVQAEPWCHNPTCPYPDAGSDANPLTADHTTPASLGGAGSVLVVLCKRCNSGKGARTG